MFRLPSLAISRAFGLMCRANYTRSEEILIRDEEYRLSVQQSMPDGNAPCNIHILHVFVLFSQTHFTDVADLTANNVLHAALIHWHQPAFQAFELCKARRCYS